jgi:hypothetical protein
MTAKRWPILVFVAACLLGAPKPAGAMAIANSSIDFKNLAITPALGTFSLDGAWFLEAFADANNSLGQVDNGFSASVSPDSISASAAVTWASAKGTASAPNDPPDLAVTGSALSDVNIPGCGPAAAFSKGRGTMFNFFTLTGGGPSVAVTFAVDIAGLLNVMTDACGLSAMTETIFTLEVDGTPILFRDDILSIGPNDTASLSFSTTLMASVMLDSFDPAGNPLSHSLLLEADSESSGLVPEPPAGSLLIAGLAALAAVRRRLAIVRMEK